MTDEHQVATAIIRLMQGVVYRESDEDAWETLQRSGAQVRDHFAIIGVDIVVDEDEGYAFLRSRAPADEGEEPLPRLVRRRRLIYHVSLLLVLLRKRMVEFETGGGAGRLVLTTEQMVEMLRLFQAESGNDARLVDSAGSTIKKVAELGFLKQLRDQTDHWEVRRILKAYVDAETLSDFAGTLRDYAGKETADE
ncbi:MAG: DUF4194 domain-containing protein [Actinobacteria bacterium]|nr:MAG: DUF4194 domain-containing protein [Actinomycetota bacterium]